MRLGYLDGIRGWASLSVLLFHASWEMFGEVVPGFRFHYGSIFDHGLFAVSTFFVLSGLVLSVGYLQTRDRGIVRRLAVRRYVRLTVPIVGAVAITYVAMKSGAMFNHEAARILHNEDWLGGFYLLDPSILRMLKFSIFDVYLKFSLENSYAPLLWTMYFELCGSFVVFFILSISSKNGSDRYFWWAVCYALCFHFMPDLLLFLLGMILADWSSRGWFKSLGSDWRGNWLGIFLVAAVFVIIATMRETFTQRGLPTLGLFAFALVGGVMLSGRLRGLLSGRVSQFLAAISFPLYLTHSIVLTTLSSFLVIQMTRSGFDIVVVAWVVFPVSVVASLALAALFRPVEIFAIALSHRFSAFVLHEGAAGQPPAHLAR